MSMLRLAGAWINSKLRIIVKYDLFLFEEEFPITGGHHLDVDGPALVHVDGLAPLLLPVAAHPGAELHVLP